MLLAVAALKIRDGKDFLDFLLCCVEKDAAELGDTTRRVYPALVLECGFTVTIDNLYVYAVTESTGETSDFHYRDYASFVVELKSKNEHTCVYESVRVTFVIWPIV